MEDDGMKDDTGLVVITGASRGIGRALAQGYVAQGRRVLAVARSAVTVEGAVPVQADLAVPGGIEAVVRAVAREGAPVDLLINNAGMQLAFDLSREEPEFAARAAGEIALNLTAPIVLTQALRGALRQPGAVVANVTSLVSRQPKPSAPVYSATKAGLASYTGALRQQMKALGVQVVEVVPPLVATEMTHGRGRGKLSAEEMAGAVIRGIELGQHVVAPGLAWRVLMLNRILPGVVRRIMARG